MQASQKLMRTNAVRTTRARAPRRQAAVRCMAAGKEKIAVVTGASSGLGLAAAVELAKVDGYRVVMACRNVAKGEAAAREKGMDPAKYTVKQLDLNTLDNVRAFAKEQSAEGIDSLICNAAVYFPQATEPTFTPDGHEESVGVNHLAHYLLVRELIPALEASEGKRCVIVGSVTGNANTVAGKVPPMADLGDLSGFANKQAAIDGGEFIGAKAYKDSKVCNMLTAVELHRRYHESTGITFSTLYPGCISESGLFRNHNAAFRFIFPLVMKNITKGHVDNEEAGWRLAQIATSPQYSASGKYWAWEQGGDSYFKNYNSENSTDAYANELSEQASDPVNAKKLWELSAAACGLPA